MQKALVLLAAGLAVATACQNPFELLMPVFKSGEIPNAARLQSQLDQYTQVIANGIVQKCLVLDYYPMNAPDAVLEFTAKPPSQQYRGHWNLGHGKVYGIESLRFYNLADLTYDNHFIYVKPRFIVENLVMAYKSLITVQNVEQEETVLASIDNYVFSYVMKIDRHNLKVYIENVVIESISPIDVRVKENNRIDRQFNNELTFDASPFYDLIEVNLQGDTLLEIQTFATEFNSRYAL